MQTSIKYLCLLVLFFLFGFTLSLMISCSVAQAEEDSSMIVPKQKEVVYMKCYRTNLVLMHLADKKILAHTQKGCRCILKYNGVDYVSIQPVKHPYCPLKGTL